MTYWLAAFSVLASLGTCAALAQTGAAVPPRTPQATAPSGLGMLILSPNQRRELEAVRRAPSSANDPLGPPPVADRGLEAADLPSAQVVNGVVIRSGNRSTVWVNGQPQYGRATAEPLRALTGQTRDALPPGSVSLPSRRLRTISLRAFVRLKHSSVDRQLEDPPS